MIEEMTTPIELAKRCGVCNETVWRWIRRNQICVRKISNRYYISQSAADAVATELSMVSRKR